MSIVGISLELSKPVPNVFLSGRYQAASIYSQASLIDIVFNHPLCNIYHLFIDIFLNVNLCECSPSTCVPLFSFMSLLICHVTLYLTLFDHQEHKIILAAIIGLCSLLYLCNTSDILLYYLCYTFAGFIALYNICPLCLTKAKVKNFTKCLKIVIL